MNFKCYFCPLKTTCDDIRQVVARGCKIQIQRPNLPVKLGMICRGCFANRTYVRNNNKSESKGLYKVDFEWFNNPPPEEEEVDNSDAQSDAGSCASNETEAFQDTDEDSKDSDFDPKEEEEVEEEEEVDDAEGAEPLPAVPPPPANQIQFKPEDLQNLHEIYVQKQIDAGFLKRVKPKKVKQPANKRRQKVTRNFDKFVVNKTIIEHKYKKFTAYATYIHTTLMEVKLSLKFIGFLVSLRHTWNI